MAVAEKCPSCKKHELLIIPYILDDGVASTFLACPYCDNAAEWPNYDRDES